MNSEKLSHARIAKAKKPGMIGDGGGLWVFLTPLKTGELSKRFVFRYRVAGRYGEVPIGPWPDVTLAEARKRATEFRAQIAKGDDPAAQRRAARGKASAHVTGAITFKQATLDYMESVGKGRWRSLGTGADWLRGFRLHVWPLIGDRPISDVGDAEAQAVLSPLFKRSPDLGRRITERAKAVYDRARVMKATAHPNPFVWSGYLSHVFPASPPSSTAQPFPMPSSRPSTLPSLPGAIVPWP